MDFREYKFETLCIYAFNITDQHFLNESSNAMKWCSELDYTMYQTLNNEKRRKEFLAVRYILWRIGFSQEVFYDGRIPKLRNEQFISISHAHEWVVVAISPHFTIGVDVELIQDKAVRTYAKFAHISEYHLFPNTDVKLATLLWSFKEVVYKMMRIDGLLFSEEICVSKNEKGDYFATVLTTHGFFEVPLAQQSLGNYVLTFNLGDAQPKA